MTRLTDFERLAERHLQVISRSGDEWMCRCPRHHDNRPSLQFNVTKGLFLCFSCGWRGSARQLGADTGTVWSDPDEELAALMPKLDALLTLPAFPAPVPTAPESTLRRFRTPTDYWSGRGIDAASCARFDLGYDPWEDAATIPLRTPGGGLLGVCRRFLGESGPGKYKNPRGFARTRSLFGAWLMPGVQVNWVCLVEGPLDAVKCWQAGIPALAQYGSSLSRTQVMLLHRLGIYRTVLFYDDDRAGRACTQQAREVLDGFAVAQVRYPVLRLRAKDPGNMPDEGIRSVVTTALESLR